MMNFRSALLAFSLLAPAAHAAVERNAQLTVGWAEPIDALNPTLTTARDVGPLLINIFDTLVWLTPDLQVTPGLAKSWTMSPDGKTYTFELRDDVTFHDGTPFDADAVVANINFITDKKTQSKISLSLLGPCTQATATGKYTVEIHCSAPYGPLLSQLGEPYLGIQSPAAIQKYGPDIAMHPLSRVLRPGNFHGGKMARTGPAAMGTPRVRERIVRAECVRRGCGRRRRECERRRRGPPPLRP